TFFGPTISTWGNEVEAVASTLTLDSFIGTSSTSNAIGLGAKTFTASINKQFVPGMYVVISDSAAPSTNSMTAQVTAYDIATGVLSVTVLFIRGTGTKTSWIITLSGDPYTSGSTTVSGDISVTNATAAGKLISTSPTAGIGYDTGAGGAVQLIGAPYTSLNKICGTVTMVPGNLDARAQAYMYLGNNVVSSNKDIILCTMVGANAGYFSIIANAYSTGAIEFVITNKSLSNKSHTGLLINFAIIRNVNA
ncbi:MAG: hypothetical protein WAW61_22205, partial [Methylococcaceae bacterium]